MTREKKKITIEVDPLQGAVTIGLLKGIFPSIIRQLEIQEVISFILPKWMTCRRSWKKYMKNAFGKPIFGKSFWKWV